jgi:hypothetical protein
MSMSNRQAVVVSLSTIPVVVVVVGRIMMVMMLPVAMVTMKGVILIAVLVGVDNAVGEDAG